ncbi:MAG: zinc-dependent alcohol dehydrogenase family protein [Lachnospiraceae bacterium]|jgi:2-desacetyl-2-hydroxyethyl bacteriochlorophyllide A dehydrogenase|nr:zinc-dependent alcohol dehydrogenase family protein [Lachnospiraceae bacterium]
MKAAVFYGKNDLRIEERSVPQIKENEVLIKVRACGVCGTDVHIFCGDEGAAKTPAGTVLGHEFAGEIAALGAGVSGYEIGDLVAVDPNQLCGGCEYCKSGAGHFCEHMIGIGTTVDGGFAEYCAAPVSQLCRYPKEVSYEAAAMTEPLSCCLHGIDMSSVRPGSTVVVIGCGMIGLLMLQLAKISGAAKLIALEPIAEKREQALELGADAALDPLSGDVKTAIEAITKQVDTVIECVGKPATIEQAIEIAGKGSTVMLFGLTKPEETVMIKPFMIFKKEITIKASFINPYTFPRAKELIAGGKMDVSSMIYEKAPLEELPKILADKNRRNKGKYVIVF